MHIAPIRQVHPARVKEMAEFAADLDQGTSANPFPEDSTLYADWNKAYYARVLLNAEECAS
jgi:hypothetical protein